MSLVILRFLKFSFIIFFVFTAQGCASCHINKTHRSFKSIEVTDFDIDEFLSPSSIYRPFTRWWWPGNDVDSIRLKEELKILAQNNFGGVEIQPFTVGINPKSERSNRVYSWHEDSFYLHLDAVMREALKQNIIVDLNAGSGWPLGGPFVKPEESILTLDIADTIISGKGNHSILVPKIRIDKAEIEKKRRREYQTLYNELKEENCTLEFVCCAKVKEFDNRQVYLEMSTLKQIPFDKKSGLITISLDDEAKHAIIAVYIRPSAEKPLYIATQKENWVTDPFDTICISNSLENLFDTRTGLVKYFGNPLRAVFMDSREYIPDRHISRDFVTFFKQKRGYDITPWLITNAIKGYDNAYSFGRDTLSRYVFGANDKKVRYDYNRTLSELFSDRACQFTSDWFQKRGLQLRSQSYGIRTDVISASGHTTIPEAEQLSGGGGDGFVKLISSGANLYNKSIVTQEAFVFQRRAYMTTPQKIKVFANKAFAAGVNQLIYHGTAYRYKTDDYGEEGWYPWASPFRNACYSSNINETYSFWKYIREINEYLARVQYALRTGRPNVDVLVYFPFIDFEASQIIRNPNELVFQGSYTKKEPFYSSNIGSYKQNPTPIQKWFMETWELINVIESSGFTWCFVNDESLLVANTNKKDNITIRGNEYKALLLANLPYMNFDVARKIKNITKNNGRILFYGEIPTKQPGYLNYKQNEEKIKSIFSSIKKEKRENVFFNDLDGWLKNINQPIAFKGKYGFIKHQSRVMSDGSILKYLWNQTEEYQTINLQVNEHNHCFWICPEQNEIVKADKDIASLILRPFEAVFFYALNANKIDDHFLKKRITPRDTVTFIKNWEVSIGEKKTQTDNLFNLREDKSLAYEYNKISYDAKFELNISPDKKYMIDLGDVFYTAEIYINGSLVGNTIWTPHQIEITDFLKSGQNTINVKVQPTKRNYFVKEGLGGNNFYRLPFSRKEPLMPVGLCGPVSILTY